MNKIKIIWLAVIFSLTVSWPVMAGNPEEEMKPYVGSQQLEHMKQLAGSWKGTFQMNGQPQEAVVEYEVVSNGTAVMERLAPQSPHEMVSIYYDEGGELVMTHYCSLGNQPKLVLDDSGADKISLVLGGMHNIDVDNEMHIHGLTIWFKGENQMTQEWISFDGGKEQSRHVMEFSRVSE